jgi:hypothetical protein
MVDVVDIFYVLLLFLPQYRRKIMILIITEPSDDEDQRDTETKIYKFYQF